MILQILKNVLLVIFDVQIPPCLNIHTAQNPGPVCVQAKVNYMRHTVELQLAYSRTKKTVLTMPLLHLDQLSMCT